MAEHGQADELAGGQGRPKARLVELERPGQPPEHLLRHELAHLRGRVLVGDNRADQSEEGASLGRVPRFQEEADEALAQPVEARSEQPGKEEGRLDRQLDRSPEDALLGAEIVEHQGRIDARPGRDAADRRGFVAALPEIGAGGGQDLLPGTTRSRSPSRTRHLARGYRATTPAIAGACARRLTSSPSRSSTNPPASQARRTMTASPTAAPSK